MFVWINLHRNYFDLNNKINNFNFDRYQRPQKICEKYSIRWGELPRLNVRWANFARVKTNINVYLLWLPR